MMIKLMRSLGCVFLSFILILTALYANHAYAIESQGVEYPADGTSKASELKSTYDPDDDADDAATVMRKKSSVETVIRVRDRSGNPVSGAVAYYKKSSWQEIGATNSQGEVKISLLPRGYKFKIVYGKIEATVTQPIKSKNENIVEFVVKAPISPVNPMSFDFEGGIDGWSVNSWDPTGFAASWVTGQGIGGSRCLGIDAITPNDITWKKSLDYLEPGKTYLMSGYIKGEGIVNHDNGSVGANMCIIGTFDLAGGDNTSLGTFDWKRFELQFTVPADGTLEIGCRLGFWSNLTTGRAFFDNLSIVPLDMSVMTGENIQMTLESGDISAISAYSLSRWISHLDDAYESYFDLVGAEPYQGEKVKVLSTRNYPGGWAVAGNPILWHQPYVKGELGRIELNDDWSFGILHEIGHVFDLDDRWNWDGEFWANMKMYYVLESLDGKVRPDYNGIYYTGTEIDTFYKTNPITGIDRTGYDSLTYSFIKIKNQIGWEPFKLTFRYFNSLDQANIPQTRLEKFNLFLDKLDDFSNPDFETRSVFTPEQLTAIESALGN